MTPLRQRFIDDLRLRHYSAKTIQVYVDAVAAFAKFCGRSPEKLGPEDVRRYLLHLIHERGLSRSQYVINLHALRNLYHVTLGRPGRLKGLPFPRCQRKLPVVLSRDEVRRLFAVVTNVKHKAVFMVAYDSGLRISEILNLRAEDIDSQRMVIRIRQGKGNRDRYARLTPGLLELLREYWRSERPRTWLFPGADGQKRLRPEHTRADAQKCLSQGRDHQACQHARAAPHLCHSLARSRHQPARDPAAAGPHEHQHQALYTHVSVEQLRHAPSMMEPAGATFAAATYPGRRGCGRTDLDSLAGGLPMRDGLEVADVFRDGGSCFLAQYGHTLSWQQRRVLRDVTCCRTAVLGGHIQRCDDCGHERIQYNSCRNRHCPKCQPLARAAWLEKREGELLPVPYFHVVFTLPHELAPLALQNKRVIYSLLFWAAAQTLLQIAADPKHLGAQIGCLMVLHTWGQNLMHHPHVHAIVTGGGLSLDDRRWIGCKKSRKGKEFLLPVGVLSRLFRGKFLHGLKRAFATGAYTSPVSANLSRTRTSSRSF